MKRCIMLCALILLGLLCTGCAEDAGTSSENIYISEGMSRNSCFAPLSDGSCCDWIELHNPTDAPVDVRGWFLSDDDRRLRKWEFTESLVIEPDGFAVVYLSGLDCVDDSGCVHAGFRLSSSGEIVVLSDSEGTLVTTWQIPECTADNVAWGLAPDGSGFGWLSQPTPGSVNTGFFSDDIATLEYPDPGVVINEYMNRNKGALLDCDSEYSDWIELHNTTSEEVDLTACALSDDADGDSRWFFPDGTTIEPDGYLVVFCSGKVKGTDCDELHAGFRLGDTDSLIQLYSAAGQPVDSMENHPLAENVSCGRDPGSGELRLYSKATPGRANTTFSYDLTDTVTADLSSGIYISETMSVSYDPRFTYSSTFVELYPPYADELLRRDFIELHNSTSSAVSLEGYRLTDGSEEVCFTFPEVEIAAGGYLAVCCTGEECSDPSQPLTAPFTLSRSGEEITLFDPSGACVDRLNSGKQTYGCSRGRIEGSMQQFVFERPTPGAANTSVRRTGYCPEPVISTADGQEGGYVDAGTLVSITVPEGCTVHYTTNGDDPDAGSAVYTKPFAVDSTTTVRAVAVREGFMPSDTAVCSFLTGEPHDLPVVMLSAPYRYILSPEEGILSDHYNGLVAYAPNYQSSLERAVSIEYYVDGRKAFDIDAGISVFGETSRHKPQRGLAVYLREKYDINSVSFPIFDDYGFSTFGAFLLRPSGQDYNQAHMRDELAAMLAKDRMAVDYMEAQPVAMYINGSYYGLYYIREKFNEDYLVNHYGADADNVDIVKWQGGSQAGSASDFIRLTGYTATHDMSQPEHYDYFCSQVDIDSLIDFWIAETFLANKDSGNIRCYRTGEDEKWRWMLFDLDVGMLHRYVEKDYIWEHCLDPAGHGDSNILPNDIPRRLFDNESFRTRFIERYCWHLQTTFSAERTLSVLEQLRSRIESEIPRQAECWGAPTRAKWDYHCQILRRFFTERPEQVRQHLMRNFGLSERELDRIMRLTADGVD